MTSNSISTLDIIRILLLNLFRDEEVGMSGKACREDAINSINIYFDEHVIKNKIIFSRENHALIKFCNIRLNYSLCGL